MSGIAFVFPGQGSQYIGMGKQLVQKYKQIKDAFVEAEKVVGINILDICLNGPEAKLNDTSNTQLCIYVLSYGIFKIIEDLGFTPQIVAGHSLGEYTALTAAKVIKYEEGLQIVAKRAELMSKEAQKTPGVMLAVLGSDIRVIDEVVEKLSVKGIIQIANYNCPGQIVLSLEKGLEEQTMTALSKAGIRKAVRLPVSGAFHSEMMKTAEEKLDSFIDHYIFLTASIPVIPNFLANPVIDANEIKGALKIQMSSSVKWQQSVEQMLALGIRKFVEVGPGHVLSKMIKRIDMHAETLATDSPETPGVVIERLVKSN